MVWVPLKRHGVDVAEVEEACFDQNIIVRATYGGKYLVTGKTKGARLLSIVLSPEDQEFYYVVTARSVSKMPAKKKGESMSKKVVRIPKFKSIEEEAKFWDTHSFTDFPLDTKRVKIKFHLKGKKEEILTVRLQSQAKRLLEQTATELGVSSSTLARMWLIERLKKTVGAIR